MELDKLLLAILVPAIFVIWILVGVGMLTTEGSVDLWQRWGGWLDWGRNFAFVTVLPYLGKKVGQGLAGAHADKVS